MHVPHPDGHPREETSNVEPVDSQFYRLLTVAGDNLHS